MKLPVGARLPHDFADIPTNDPEVVQRNRALYRITHVLSETPWSCLYRGKKVFRNFEFAKGTLTEAAEDECLDVLIRTLSYPRTDDRDYIQARREHSWFEAKQVLGCRHTNLIAEPLDYLQVRNDQDQFAFPRPGNIPTTEPVLVFETIHGDNLARWRQAARVDAVRGLHVLGQMLEFLATLHDAKLLLNVVSPAAFWVDELHRVHFLGTENVVDDRRAATWRSLFPNERYAQGFVAPELLQPNAPPSRQSDLYGWAALVWFLLTGDSPAKLAADQQQRWARFEPAHRERLHRELARLSPHQVAEMKRELNVAGTRFESLWPGSFLGGLWACLDTDHAQRPGSVADLRAWWGNPPPPPVPACLAIRKHPTAARIAFSTTGLREGLQFQVSRRFAQPPLSPTDGDVAWRGNTSSPIEVVVPLPPEPRRGQTVTGEWCFSIFAVETQGGITSVSRATQARGLDGTAPGFRRAFAESIAGSAGALPDEIALLGQLDPIELVAAELLDSSETRVRGWAVSLLERGVRAGSIGGVCRRLLEERALVDDENAVRQQAASTLIRTCVLVDVELIVELAQRMGEGAVDEMIRAARGFAAFGVSASVIDRAIEALEQAHRIVVCAVCQQELRARELDLHLTTEHHYVPLDGKLLPFGQALTRLWSRVLQHFDTAALQTLTGHLQHRHPQSVVSAFASALAQQVLFAWQSHWTHQSEEQRQTWNDGLARCLRSDQAARSACWSLLPHGDSRIRELARGVVLVAVAMRLSGGHITVVLFRRAVDELAPVPIVSERIEACRRLIELGANPLAGELCERELDLERLLDCPECGTTFPKRDLASHRRKEHHVFEWESRRYEWDSLVALLLGRTVAVEPDAFAARCLMELFVERHGNGAWQPLYLGLRDQLRQSAGPEDLEALASGLGAAVGPLPLSVRLMWAFLAENDAVCQTAALAIFANRDADPPADLSRLVATRVSRTDVPFSLCQQAVVSLLRRPRVTADIIRSALLELADRANDKLQGVGLLHDLEQWVGASPAIEAVCAELLSKIRMRCPRCEVSGTPTELAEHVRTEHGLILQGRSVRKPWSVAMDCLDEYAENPQSHLLERAEQLAVLASPDSGRRRLLREALRRGIAPDDYACEMIAANQSTSLSLCPECWESISTGEAPLNEVQIDAQGNVHWDAVSIRRVGLHGVWSSVEITPWDGPAPPWTFTQGGAIAAAGLVFLIPSALFGILAWQGLAAAQSFAVLGFLMGLASMAAAAFFYSARPVEPVDVAWELVVPALLDDDQQPFGIAHSTFLASLAGMSCGRGNAAKRRAVLNRAIEKVQGHMQPEAIPSRHLAELWHLLLRDDLLVGHGGETILHILRAVFHGQLSLEFLDQVTRKGTELLRLHNEAFYVVTLPAKMIAEAATVGLTNEDLQTLRGRSPTIAFLLRDASNTHGLRGRGANRELMLCILLSPGTRCPQCETLLHLRKGQLAERMSELASAPLRELV